MSAAFKIASKVKELRIHLCQTSPTSQGVRDFIEKYYVEIKKNNPQFPILIRECSGAQPKLWARLEQGKEKAFALNDCTADDVLNKLQSVAK